MASKKARQIASNAPERAFQRAQQAKFQAWLRSVLGAWADGHVKVYNKIVVNGGWHKPYSIDIFSSR